MQTAKSQSSRKVGAGKGIDLNLPPLHNIEEIFEDMASKALKLGLASALKDIGRPINVATMCSGTEAPLIALQLLSKALVKMGKDPIQFVHHFSAEIDAIKQAYIERNFQPKYLFRDVREFSKDAESAVTAYGAEVEIPRLLDILVVGFVCKDLSRLNNHQRSLEDGGESGDTWAAVRAYAEKFRPSVVLVENVASTTTFWNGFKERWHAIGYECAWLYRDTKNYYLPQTRKRMYMVAIDKHQYGNGVGAAAKRWLELIQGLERQCSSPFESFLKDDLDAETYAARTSEVEWALCKLRYDQIRAEERLGTRRPVTQWSENGSVRPPDIANRKWYHSQSTRVYDAIDVAYLQGAAAGYDALYKMLIWDVSQNVDRFHGSYGIVPCITPSGCDFVTNKQTALSGSQLLILQGMPEDKLLFARETQKDRQDLAGNAMSTTVIGASIIAALISSHTSFRQGIVQQSASVSGPEPESRLVAPGSAEEITILPPNLGDLDLDELLDDARNSARLCQCEGAKHVSQTAIQICGSCGHSACSSCAGNPKHAYANTMPRDIRIPPNDFENKWRPRLPAQLHLDQFEDLSHAFRQLGKAAHVAKWTAIVVSETKPSNPFFMSTFQRKEQHWTIVYRSVTNARLELEIGNQVKWFLYVNSPRSESSKSELRMLCKNPLARGIAKGTMLDVEWEVFIPAQRSSTLTLTGSSDRRSSWRSRLGLLAYRDETVPIRIEVQSSHNEAVAKRLCGTYELLPHCSSAMSSLYKRSFGKPLYLFLDPDPIGPNEKDSFVFSETHRRIAFEDHRIISAQLSSNWRPWNLESGNEKSTQIKIDIPGTWRPATIKLSTPASPVIARVPSAAEISTCCHGDCGHAITVLDVEATTPVDTRDYLGYSWILEHARRRPTLHTWNAYDATCPRIACTCAPQPPRTLWHVNEDGAAKAAEDRQAAAHFERALKTRPPVFSIKAASDSDGSRVEIGLNIATLVHRARNRLSSLNNCRTAWRLVTNHVDPAWEPFNKFYLTSNSEDEPYNGPLRLELELVDAQKKSLAWMRNQELGKSLTVTEVEEEVNHDLGWRAEALAQAEVTVRGGVLADLPSFGKTVTTIGLIHSYFETRLAIKEASKSPALIDVAATLIVCPAHLVKQWRTEFERFLRPKHYRLYNVLLIETFEQLRQLSVKDVRESRAIILSWRVLADEQYIAQLAQFTAVPEPTTTRGRAFDAWLDYVTEQIPSRVQELTSKGPAHFESHTDEALKARLKNPEFQATVPLKVLHGSAYQSHKEKGLQSSAKTTGKTKSAPSHTRKRTVYKEDAEWSSYQGPVLQMFNFDRLVVDEYHYLLEQDKDSYPSYSSIKRMSAGKRWLLSGTPALGSFAEVNQIASLLGTTLGRHVFGPKMTKMERRAMEDQTDVEKFLSQTEVMSYQWHQARHQRAQEFLNLFVRQNEPCLRHIECAEVLRPIELDIAHQSVYLELSQHLISQKMMVKKLKANDKSDRTERLHASLNGSSTAEEALLKAALHFQTEAGSTPRGGSASGLSSLLSKRKEQILDTKEEILGWIAKAENARRQEGNEPYQSFKLAVLSGENVLGDGEADQEVRDLLKAGSEGKKKGSTVDFKRLTSNLGVLSKELTLRMRSLRFIDTINSLLPVLTMGESSDSGTRQCASPNCPGTEPAELFLVSDCGHLACQSCLDARADSEACVRSDCDVHVHGTNLVRISSLRSGQRASREMSFGAKLDAIADLILGLPKQDQAIVFVPNDEVLDAMEEVLEHHRISYYAVTRSKRSSAGVLEDFKNQTDPKKRRKVLILNLDDESASGVNLVNANHVIFAAPLLAESQYKYDSSMVQAIARCRRYGQKKKVHIYHFAALRTIDVDILEHRHKRVDAVFESESQAPLAIEPSAKKEKTKLIRNAAGLTGLVPISWLRDEAKREELGLVEGELESFTSLIDFSDTFKDDED
ncbi:uncharacterized protein EI97DRAFT_387612 [Westerdykella ornata]|uniref:Helicase C-terminal domain-containing protein n=1 Tax=Westerdykella ornata TaxID=318751 RepID=A0A6A6J545_WESOR|nr:uncharacterized protein EI97DRAFT_387612 [Westerdykella ornata]KAF2271565.1 hypothetical protein EI97DRAFT_387612 [Westerdykella ornata]